MGKSGNQGEGIGNRYKGGMDKCGRRGDGQLPARNVTDRKKWEESY